MKAYFDSLDAEIIAFQETKVANNMAQIEDVVIHIEGYESFWSICKKKPGYSGVVTYVKKGLTLDAKNEFSRKDFDDEGRVIMTDHGSFLFFNVYFPNSGNGDRLPYKMDFYRWFEELCDGYLAQGRKIIVAGDVNTTHSELDIWSPEKLTSGLFKDERVWMDHFFQRQDKEAFVDTFRKLHPTARKYTWWDVKNNLRIVDSGYRLDYFLVNASFMPQVQESEMMTEQLGSDHCPIYLILEPQQVPERTSVPALSSDKIRAKQPKISSFFSVAKKTTTAASSSGGSLTTTTSKTSETIITTDLGKIEPDDPPVKEKQSRPSSTSTHLEPEPKRLKLVSEE